MGLSTRLAMPLLAFLVIASALPGFTSGQSSPISPAPVDYSRGYMGNHRAHVPWHSKVNGDQLSGMQSMYPSIPDIATNSASRLSSPLALSRQSAAISSILSTGGPNMNSLANVISSVSSSVAASNPDLPGTENLVQTLLETISALVHVLSSSTIGAVNVNAIGDTSQIVGQSVVSALT